MGHRTIVHPVTGTATGGPQRAQDVACSMEFQDIRAEALISIAEAVEPNHARRLTAEAFIIGRWTVSFNDLQPGSFVTLVSSVRRRVVDRLAGDSEFGV